MRQNFGLEPDAFVQPSVQSEYYEEDDSQEEVDGVPWYLYDSEANAQVGTEFDMKNLNELRHSEPPPCSDEFVCLLVRKATLSMKVRARRITIDKLWGSPVFD